MSFVIEEKKSTAGYRYVINDGDTVEIVDPRGRRASFEVVLMMGTSQEFAWRNVDKETCTRNDMGAWDPDPEAWDPIEDSEFMPPGDYIVLRPAKSNPGTCALIIPPPVSTPTPRST